MFDESKFHMWRACIAIIWVDGKVSEDERQWIEEKITSLPFDSDQRKQLHLDLLEGTNFKSLVDKISRPADRGFVSHQIRVISHLDGVVSPKEKELLETWNKYVMQNIDPDVFDKIESSGLDEAGTKQEALELLISSYK